MYGFIDRFEGNLAVILVEETKEEFTVLKERLPAGSDVHTYLEVEKRDGSYHIMQIASKKTAEANARTRDLMAQLRARKSGSTFQK